MASAKLFEYAILYHPKPKKDAQGNDVTQKSELLAGVDNLLARDEKQAGMMIARLIPEEYVDKLECLEVIVRPF